MIGNWRGTTRQQVRSMAVLPLVNLSGDVSQEYLADGITEALTASLAELGAFQVTSRTSAMTFKGGRQSIRQIAERLKTDALLEGSVCRSGNRVRVMAQLIDARTDTHLFSGTFEREVKVHLNKFTNEGFKRGIAYLEQSIEKDPANPVVHAKLGLGYVIAGHDRSPELLKKAKAAAQRSLALDTNAAEAHRLGF
jgi:TolB-like protein